MAELRLGAVQAWFRVLYAVVFLPLVAAIGAAATVAWLLWGTGFSYSSSQELLAEQFAMGATDQPVARITAPAIDLDAYVMAGVSNDALTDGPGRYPGTAAPGGPGNIVIGGRRATYGSPFARIDELLVGDEIRLTTIAKTWVYVVTDTLRNRGEPNLLASRETEGLLAGFGGAHLTLVGLDPPMSARSRLLVYAELSGEPAAVPLRSGGLGSPAGLGAEPIDWPAIGPGAAVAFLAWLAMWLIGRPTQRTLALHGLALVFVVAGMVWVISQALTTLPPY